MRIDSILLVALIGSQAALAADAQKATGSVTTESSASSTTTATQTPQVSSSANSALTPAIAANASASATPAAATMNTASPGTTTAVDASPTNKREPPRLNAKRPLSVKARLDDGRSTGFHQDGGDQPAGDQQLRQANRVQTENDRLARESRERRNGTGELQPAARDQPAVNIK